MDLRSLRYFTETVRLGSFTDAARQLDVTQSTISKMIRQLEDEVGEPLMLREARKITLTDTGKVVYERGLEILKSMQQLQVEIRETQSVARGRLILGIPPMINIIFTEVLKAFRNKYPKIELILTELTGQQAEHQVANGDIMVGMSLLPIKPIPEINLAVLSSQRIVAIGNTAFFPNPDKIISLQSLSSQPLILPNDEFALTRLIRQKFAMHGLEPRVTAQSGQWDWAVEMARAGMGIAFVPESFVQRINQDGLVIREIVQPNIDWEVAILWHQHHFSHALLAWLALCKDMLGGQWPDLPEP